MMVVAFTYGDDLLQSKKSWGLYCGNFRSDPSQDKAVLDFKERDSNLTCMMFITLTLPC